MPPKFGRTLLMILGIGLAGFLALQFARPSLTNPPVTAEIQAPPEVRDILRNSCYSCHSNETKLPWYDQIVPAYWLVNSDVKEARKHLNFSEIGKLPPAQQKGVLFEGVNFIQMGAMPLLSYLRVHPHAAVSDHDLAMLRAYLTTPSPAPQSSPGTPTPASLADAQYDKWIASASASGSAPLKVVPEFNGVEFLSDYKNWVPISSTDRFDNHTMRQILGNPVAIKAIAENHINPWPDGTVFAKVAWAQQPDDHGTVHTGPFIQVELMIRDSKKYADTKGWGWGRWRGMDLKPYGKDKDFTNECIGCHEPVAKNDYVYTMPFQGQQADVRGVDAQ